MKCKAFIYSFMLDSLFIKKEYCWVPFWVPLKKSSGSNPVFKPLWEWTRRESNPYISLVPLENTGFQPCDNCLTPIWHHFLRYCYHVHCESFLFFQNMNILIVGYHNIRMSHQFTYHLNWDTSSDKDRSKCMS